LGQAKIDAMPPLGQICRAKDTMGNTMNRLPLSALIAASLVLVPAAAFAAHGRVGLWTITSTMQMSNAPQIPPEALAMMKARHLPIPNSGEPFTTQMCMTQEQVNADKPPAMNNRNESCDTKVLNQSPALMEAEITCHGRMTGVGHLKISWRGSDHYEGMYNFKGTMQGHPQEMTTHYTGDFVKTDCGSVKPFVPPRSMQ
jgi:hypothetical protein